MAASFALCHHKMTFKSFSELWCRKRVFSSMLNVNLLQNNARHLSHSNRWHGSDFSKDESQKVDLPKKKPAFRTEASNRLGHLMQLYEDLVGLTEVKSAQDKVVAAEQKFLQVQDDRRAMQQELVSVQAEVRAVAAELEKTSRTETRYIDLVKKEHEALLIEKDMTGRMKTLDKAERDFFALLSAALRESHEKERSRAEKTKYWSIIGSICGAIIGIVGSTLNNMTRMKELRAIVTESGQNTAEYKALANQMVEAVHTQHLQMEQFVDSMSNLEQGNGTDKIAVMDGLFVKHKDFSQQTQLLLAALHDQSEILAKNLEDIHKRFCVGKADGDNEQVIYVGPALEQMFLTTERRLEAELQRTRWLTAAVFGGLAALSVCLFIFRGST